MAIANHPVNTLAGISLPRGVAWPNRRQHPLIGQQLIRMLDGSIDQYAQANSGVGQLITLTIALPACYLTQAQYAALHAQAAIPGANYTLAWGDYVNNTWNTTNYIVIFDYQSGAAIDVTRFIGTVASEGGRIEYFTGQINLLRIA